VYFRTGEFKRKEKPFLAFKSQSYTLGAWCIVTQLCVNSAESSWAEWHCTRPL